MTKFSLNSQNLPKISLKFSQSLRKFKSNYDGIIKTDNNYFSISFCIFKNK